MKIKKYFVGFVASTMLVSTCYCIKPVEAIDFSKDEDLLGRKQVRIVVSDVDALMAHPVGNGRS